MFFKINIFMLIFTLFFVLTQKNSKAQNGFCKTHEIHEYKLQEDAAYADRYNEFVSKVNTYSRQAANLPCNDNTIIEVPVAVHFGTEFDCSNTQCLIDATESQLNSLNTDFAGDNMDLDLYYDLIEATNQNDVASNGVCIKFCLANQNHPTGSGLADGEPAITVGIYNGGAETDINQDGNPEVITGGGAPLWDGYLNIFVVHNLPRANSGIYTGSWSDGIGIPDFYTGAGVTINATNFGGPDFVASTSCGPLNSHSDTYWNYEEGESQDFSNTLGRHLTHEVGHFLGLHHPFSSTGGCAFVEPGVNDTPNQSNYSSECYDTDTDCTSLTPQLDLITGSYYPYTRQYNFMDYFMNSCQVMFTKNQQTVLRNTTNDLANIGFWKTNTGCADLSSISIATPPTPSFTGLPGSTSSSSPISLTGAPSGGTFSGPGIIFNAFNPSIVPTGIHTITYTVDNSNGCPSSVSQTILVFTITYNFVTYNLGTINPRLDGSTFALDCGATGGEIIVDMTFNEPYDVIVKLIKESTGQETVLNAKSILSLGTGYPKKQFKATNLQAGKYVLNIEHNGNISEESFEIVDVTDSKVILGSSDFNSTAFNVTVEDTDICIQDICATSGEIGEINLGDFYSLAANLKDTYELGISLKNRKNTTINTTTFTNEGTYLDLFSNLEVGSYTLSVSLIQKAGSFAKILQTLTKNIDIKNNCQIPISGGKRYGAGEEIEVFPNPVSDFVDLQSSLKGKFLIYNAQGKEMESFDLSELENEKRIDLSDWPTGSYFIKHKASNTLKKIIKL